MQTNWGYVVCQCVCLYLYRYFGRGAGGWKGTEALENFLIRVQVCICGEVSHYPIQYLIQEHFP